MFEVGFTEIVLIVGRALIVLGPEKLPGLVSKVGRWTGRARSMARQLRMQLEHEVSLDELSKVRPMQGGPPPSADAESTAASHFAAADYETPAAVDDMPTAAESSSHTATETHEPRPVDLSKPLQ
jgi:sec-independent protein translocase protein TatB